MNGGTWMPLYVADWEADTCTLTCEQDGAYGRLVRHYWRCGPPPDDDAKLARIVGLSVRKWRVLRSSLESYFSISNGVWRHKRVDAELAKSMEIRASRSQAGKTGGRPKKQMLNKSFSNEKQNESQSQLQLQTPSESSSVGDKSPTAQTPYRDPGAEAWKQAVALLRERSQMSEDSAKKFFGALLRDHHLAPAELLSALGEALGNGTKDPKSYLAAAAKHRQRKKLNDDGLTMEERYIRSTIQ